MSKFLKSIAKIFLVLLIIGVIVVYVTLLGVGYKGEYAASISALQEIRTIANQYYLVHMNTFTGFCEDAQYLNKKQFIENIDRTGILNWEPYRVKCVATTEDFAVSMTSYIDLFGEPTDESYVCVSSGTETLVKQNIHVENPSCNTQS